MDPNLGRAVLARSFTSSYLERMNAPVAERDLAPPSREGAGRRGSLIAVVRAWTGTSLIHLGMRISQVAPPEPVDTVVTS